ncbi:MAG: hypothetical protein U0Y68_26720 [Blastocatellia bacterium]
MNWKLSIVARRADVCARHHCFRARRQPQPHDLWSAWSLEPLVILSLLLALGCTRAAWCTSGGRRAELRPSGSRAFLGGWLALVVALVSPLDALGSAALLLRI